MIIQKIGEEYTEIQQFVDNDQLNHKPQAKLSSKYWTKTQQRQT